MFLILAATSSRTEGTLGLVSACVLVWKFVSYRREKYSILDETIYGEIARSRLKSWYLYFSIKSIKKSLTKEARIMRKEMRHQVRLVMIERQRQIQIEQQRAKDLAIEEQQRARDLAIEEQRKQREIESVLAVNKLQTFSTDQLLEFYAVAKENASSNKFLPEINFVLGLRNISTESKQLAISNYRLKINRQQMLNMEAQQRAAQQLYVQQLNQELQHMHKQQNKRRIRLGIGFWF